MERWDLQRLLRSNIDVVAPGTMVVAEEFGDWIDSRRRIDLLAIDHEAHLVVIELKRTEDGGHMELQALRYAAMISTMTFEQVVDAHARFRQSQSMEGDAREAILEFLGWVDGEEDLFGQDVRIVLAAGEFSKEITTAVIWLNKRDLDIRCVRLRPYLLNDEVLLDVQQVVPLPEAAEYQVHLRAKEQGQRAASGLQSERFEFWRQLLERARARTSIHSQISPSSYGWITASAGRSGLFWNYAVRQYDARVELYIDFGDSGRNDALFADLLSQREAIEVTFNGELDWKPLPGIRACRIQHVIPLGGYRSSAEEWPAIQDAMVDAMIRIEHALGPKLDQSSNGNRRQPSSSADPGPSRTSPA